MTNREYLMSRLGSMSDEQLVRWLYNGCKHCTCCSTDKDHINEPSKGCLDEMVKWLKEKRDSNES